MRVKYLVAGSWLSRYQLILLASLWLSAQVLCWHYYQGPRLLGDGNHYLAYAQRLANTGTFAAGHYRRYAGYSVFIAFFLKLGLGLWTVALTQVALSGLAAWAFYSIAQRLTQPGGLMAATATAAWVSWISVQAFNPFILTESLFSTCLVLCLWALMDLRNSWSTVTLVALLLVTVTIRPNGFIPLAAASVAGLSYLWSQGQRVWALVGLLVGLVAGVLAVNHFVADFNVLAEYAKGSVIFKYAPTHIAPPSTLVLPPASGWPIEQLGFFVANNSGYFCHLCMAKALYFLGYPRPWYSLLHRVWAFGVLPLVYVLAILGLMCNSVAPLIRLYLATAIALQLSIVMLTTEEWDSRFSAPFIAYWLQLAILGGQFVGARWVAKT